MDVTESIRHSFTRGEPSPSPGRGALGGKSMVLVVERDPHVRELAAFYLNGAGFAVEFALDGNAGLAQARALHPDLVITEILVPHLDGLALCRTLKAAPDTAGISVLVFSILASRARALEAGADAFLMKPIEEQRLLTTVRQLLDSRVMRHQEVQA